MNDITPKMVLDCKIRDRLETIKLKHSKPYTGGRIYSKSRNEILREVAEEFGVDLLYCMYNITTYSRSCTHSWSDGPCIYCPP